MVLIPYHNPLRIAEDYATLDLLSGGRLEFGVGTGFNLMLIPLLHEVDDLAEKVQIYFRARRAAGHDVDAARVLAAYHVCVGETSGEAREAGAQGVKEYIGASGAAHALTQVEEPESFRAHLAHRSAMRSLSFGDLVERNRVLVGNAEEVRDRLRYLRERLCLTDVAGLFALGGLADEQVRASMRRFMRDVVPQVT